jgi:hypothetical protein
MAALIHIGSRTYSLSDDAEPQKLASDITKAMDAKGTLIVQVQVAGQAITLYINTAMIDVIALDWNGVGQGFFHG